MPARRSTHLTITPGKCELPSNSVHGKDTHYDDFAPEDPSKKQCVPTHAKQSLPISYSSGNVNGSSNDDNDDNDDDDDDDDDDSDDRMDNDFDANNDFDHGNDEEFNSRNEDNFDNGNEDKDECMPSTNTPSQTCALTPKILSQKSHPSSQTKHIDDEDD